MVARPARAGGTTGIGWTYGAAPPRAVVRDKLAGVVERPRRHGRRRPPSTPWSERSATPAGPASPRYAVSAVDVALWDLKARLLDLPLHRLLGARPRRRCRSTAAAASPATTTSQLREQLRGWVDEQRIPRVKIKIGESWGAASRRDLARIAQARRVDRRRRELFVDANGGYSRKQAIRVMAAPDDHGVTLVRGAGLLRRPGRAARGPRRRVAADVTAGEYGYDLAYFRRMCARRRRGLPAGRRDPLRRDHRMAARGRRRGVVRPARSPGTAPRTCTSTSPRRSPTCATWSGSTTTCASSTSCFDGTPDGRSAASCGPTCPRPATA